jgi:hypothetical protein
MKNTKYKHQIKRLTLCLMVCLFVSGFVFAKEKEKKEDKIPTTTHTGITGTAMGVLWGKYEPTILETKQELKIYKIFQDIITLQIKYDIYRIASLKIYTKAYRCLK